ncbi:TIR domain-containing protein [uncultured Methylobacterium sp.]|uniref:TIR domain-containing protein n=1 Tax=uncultured Methylobacterium sp. TaxID=157278 RepID=UPI0035CA5ACB
MARHTFFSFHHQLDNWRAGQVRNSWVTQDRVDAGFWDAAEWEKVKKLDKASIQNWIDGQMKGTSVTVVLIGAETSQREHVKYEISQSVLLGKGMLGIYVHNVKNKEGLTTYQGSNPLPSGYPTYNWIFDDGRANIGSWIEAAAKKAGK